MLLVHSAPATHIVEWPAPVHACPCLISEISASMKGYYISELTCTSHKDVNPGFLPETAQQFVMKKIESALLDC